MENYITRDEHAEFTRRMDAENERQNHRLNELEKTVGQIHSLTTSVAKLAQSVETFAEELKKQGDRVETLENRDGEKWRGLVAQAASAVVGAILAIVLAKIGLV